MIPPGTSPGPIDRLAKLREERNKFCMRTRLAPITERGYAYDWTLFARWCVEEGLTSLPATADTVGLYITAVLVAGRKISTAERRFWAIRNEHRSAALPLPACEEVRAILSGAQRIRLETPDQATPLTLMQIEQIAGSLVADSPSAARNRAIVTFMFFSVLRRSSLSALMLSDIEFTPEGIIVHLRKEKQDQKGDGRLIGLPTVAKEGACPVAAVRGWLKHRGESDGPLFTRLDYGGQGKRLAPQAIGEVIKRCVSGIGLDPTHFSAHSTRAGFITEASLAGISETIIADHSGHKSMKVLRGYFRRTELWRANAAGMIGL
jgi:integrase